MFDNMDNVIIVPSKIEGEVFGKVGDLDLKVRLVNPDAPSERLWAHKVQEDRYRLASIPSFSMEYFYGDLVSVKEVPGDMPEISGKLEDSGHLPLVLLGEFKDTKTARKYLAQLEKAGAITEVLLGELALISAPESRWNALSQLVFGQQPRGLQRFVLGVPGPLLAEFIAARCTGNAPEAMRIAGEQLRLWKSIVEEGGTEEAEIAEPRA